MKVCIATITTCISLCISHVWGKTSNKCYFSNPTKEWETSVRPIQEGPRPLIVDKEGKTIIMYSANASWTDEYCLGSLTNTDGDYLNPSSWVKSVDGKEDWIIFHAAREKGSGWNRVIHTQPFTWSNEGNPIFGSPIPRDQKIEVPSSECDLHE